MLLGKENAVTDSADKEMNEAAPDALATRKGPLPLFLLIAVQLIVAVITVCILIFPYRTAYQNTQAKDAHMLNQLADKFHQLHDRWPGRNGGVWELAVSGVLDYKTDRTKYQQLYDEFFWNKKTLRFEPK